MLRRTVLCVIYKMMLKSTCNRFDNFRKIEKIPSSLYKAANNYNNSLMNETFKNKRGFIYNENLSYKL